MSDKKSQEPKEGVHAKMVVVEEVENTSPLEEKIEDVAVTDEVVTNEAEVENRNEEPKDNNVEVVNEDNFVDQEKTSIGKMLWIIIPTTLLVGALAGGVITYFSGISSMGATIEPTPIATVTPVVQESPVPQPDSSLKREDLKIQVLNGSGVAGSAGKAVDFLEGLGYVNVAAGNAASSNFATTEISIKSTKEEYLDLITQDLSKNYTIAEDSKTLAASSAYDVVITLGTK